MADVPAAARDQLRILAETRYTRRIRAARSDLATFIEMCGRDEAGNDIELHPLHLSWIWHLNYCWSRGLRAMIQAPFGSGKTSTLAVPLAAFAIGCDPQVRIKFVCSGDDLAEARVGAVKTMVESWEYKQVFPHVRRGAIWGTEKIQVHRRGNAVDPTLQARGVLTKGVGLRADIMIFDDVVDQLNSEEPASRAKVKNFVRKTWLSRLDQKNGRALWIATPWNVDDATHDLMQDPRWCTLVQRVDRDLEHYELEVFNAGPDYRDSMFGGDWAPESA